MPNIAHFKDTNQRLMQACTAFGSALLAEKPNISDVFDGFLEDLRDILQASGVGLMMYVPELDALQITHSAGLSPDYVAVGNRQLYETPADIRINSPAYQAFVEARPMYLSGFLEDASHPFHALAAMTGANSFYVAPIVAGDVCSGVITVYHPDVPDMDREDILNWATFAAQQAGLAHVQHGMRTKLEVLLRMQAEDLNDALLAAQSDLGEGFLMTDGRQLTYVNEAFCRMTGYTMTDLLALPQVFDIIDADDRQVMMDRMAGRQSGSDVPDNYEARVTHALGHTIYLEVAIKAVRIAMYPRFVVIARDITARKTAELALAQRTQDLEATNAKLQQAVKDRNELIQIVSHELRTPLLAIHGYATRLKRLTSGHLIPEALDSLEWILNGIGRMKGLITDLLDYSRIQAGRFELFAEPTNYTRLVHDVVRSMEHLIRAKEITVGIHMHRALTVKLDPQRITQVITNLVSNAVKFTPEGRKVLITVREDEGRVVTEITDTGIGITQEQMAKLWQPFELADAERSIKAGGTGLGLSISKAIIESHGGEVGASSEPGKGSTFWFSLPQG